MVSLLYVLAKELRDNGILVDLSVSSIVKDIDKRLKFLRKSNKTTEFFDTQFVQLFMNVMTASDKRETQVKVLKDIESLPGELKDKLINSPIDQSSAEMLIHFLRDYMEREVEVQITVAGMESMSGKCGIKNEELILTIAGHTEPTYALKIMDCAFEYRKTLKIVDVIIRH